VACATEIPNEPIFLDVPENNRAALELVARYRMREVFGCARMVIGHVPATFGRGDLRRHDIRNWDKDHRRTVAPRKTWTTLAE
jgi:GNAT acetyltransferase-like protein